MNLTQRLKSSIKYVLFGPPARSAHGAAVILKRPRRVEGSQYMQFGDRVVVAAHSWIAAFDKYAGQSYAPSLSIGNDVTIGRYACITAVNRIEIGEGCLFSEHVYISDHIHLHDPHGGLLVRQPLHSKGPVTIGPSCFLGYRVSVLPGVTLGAHCVVGAHAVVTHSFEPFSMLAGTPARVIRKFNHDTRVWEPV